MIEAASHLRLLTLATLVVAAAGCTDGPVIASAHRDGLVRLSVTGGGEHDVASFELAVVENGGDCLAGPLVASSVIALDETATAGEIFVVSPGVYLVCASPLAMDGSPSTECAVTSTSTTAVANVTTEMTLVSQCDGDDTGAVDVTAQLNDAPVIDDLRVSPSTFIRACEQADITLSARDDNGDSISYTWLVSGAPLSASPLLAPAGASAVFSSDTLGDYEVTVSATDEHGAAMQVSFPVVVSPGNCDWLVAAHGTGDDVTTGVAVDSASNVIGVGEFDSPTLSWGSITLAHAGGGDVFVVKLAPTGEALWARSFGSAAYAEGAGAIAVDNHGDIIVGGSFSTGSGLDLGCGPLATFGNRDAFVAKLTGLDGSCVWSRSLGGALDEQTVAVATDAVGDVLLVGNAAGTVTIGGGVVVAGGGGDMVYAKLDGADGGVVWSHAAGSPSAEAARSIRVDSSGDFVIAGHFTAAFTFPGAGALTHAGGEDSFVMKARGNDGLAIWARQSGALASDEGVAVAFDSNDDVLLGGNMRGPLDWGGAPMTPPSAQDNYVVKLSGIDGTHLWSAQAYSSGTAWLAGVAVGLGNRVRVIGSFTHAVDWGGTTLAATGTADVYFAELAASSGVRLDVRQGAGDGDDTADGGIAIDRADDSAVVAGAFGVDTQSFTFGGAPGAVTSSGGQDAYVARLAR